MEATLTDVAVKGRFAGTSRVYAPLAQVCWLSRRQLYKLLHSHQPMLPFSGWFHAWPARVSLKRGHAGVSELD